MPGLANFLGGVIGEMSIEFFEGNVWVCLEGIFWGEAIFHEELSRGWV